jgi:hypothetical protein
MEYREIVAVTGLGGLYQLLSTKADGAIVRSLADRSTKFISARLHNVTPLESIEIYTTGDNVRLHNVLEKMRDAATQPIDGKADNNAIKGYFKEVYPDMDEDRVYVSDMKKILKWYDLLKANDLLHFEQQEQSEEDAVAEAPKAEDAPAAEEKPAKKAAPKKKKEEAETAEVAAEGEEKPAKKARAKKAAPTAEGEEKPAKKVAKKKKEEE